MNSKISTVAAWILVIGGGIYLLNTVNLIITPTKEQRHVELTAKIKRNEICYEGVVYFNMLRRFSVKFNKDNTVATCK